MTNEINLKLDDSSEKTLETLMIFYTGLQEMKELISQLKTPEQIKKVYDNVEHDFDQMKVIASRLLTISEREINDIIAETFWKNLNEGEKKE